MTTLREINCAEATDRAAFFVLGVLDGREMLEVREHLEVCTKPHEEFGEIGGVVGYLAALPDELEPEPSLRQRVLQTVEADVRARRKEGDAAEKLVAWFEKRARPETETQLDAETRAAPVPVGPGLPDASAQPVSLVGSPAEPATGSEPPIDDAGAPLPSDRAQAYTEPIALEPTPAEAATIEPIPMDPVPAAERAAPETEPAALPVAAPQRRRRPWRAWLLAAAALVVVAALVGWNVLLQLQAAEERQRLEALRDALAARNAPNAVVAVLAGTDRAPGASATAVMPPAAAGYLVVSGLPPAPTGMTYQAWYMSGSQARSAGTFAIGSDGMGVLSGLDSSQPVDAMAVTLEREPGVERSAEAPVLYGTVSR